jgi:pyruvate kinase
MNSAKKTKIVATIGPATESAEKLAELLKAGLNVMRLNFSHGDFAEHQKRVNNFRAAQKKTGISGAILQDLGGPKIRIGNFSTEMITLKEGQKFTLTTEDIVGDETRVSINYPLLPKEVAVGHTIFLHDGRKKLEVTAIKGNDVVTKVVVGGDIRGKRGVNLPDAELSISSLTEKDRKDLEFGVKNKVDFFALSFVRRPSDITELREILDKKKCKAGIIAKIETPQAVANIDEIISLCDGIMVARGDLAIEVPAEKVPMIQKSIIGKCNDLGKPVITATQMLESMIHAPVPTRAEVSDVANAILDGTDAVMLSEETAMGEFPVNAVKLMTRVAGEVERDYPEYYAVNTEKRGEMDHVDSLSGAVANMSHDIGAKAIYALTESGYTPRMISRYKPEAPLVALTTVPGTFNKLHLTFGCTPVMIDRVTTVEELIKAVKAHAVKNKLARKGEKVVVSGSAPFNKSQKSNFLMIVEI